MPAPPFEHDLESLFDEGVLARAVPITDEPPLMADDEQRCVAKAVTSRKKEFAQGRALARMLIRRLGFDVESIPCDADRVPRWPPGVVGTISHSRDLCAAAVGPESRMQGLGLDIEPDEPLEPEIWNRICISEERRWIAAQPTEEQGRCVRLIFSAKEAVYKCRFPKERRRLEFSDVRIIPHLEDHQFDAILQGPQPAAMGSGSMRGRFQRRNGWLFTAVCLPTT